MNRVIWINLGVFFGTALAAGGFLVAYDVWRAATGGRESTISHAMYTVGQITPLFAFLCGVVGSGLLIGLGVHFWGK